MSISQTNEFIIMIAGVCGEGNGEDSAAGS